MGGNALKEFNVKRISKVDYLETKKAISLLVESFGLRWFVPPDMPDKVDFGDLDIIITGTDESRSLFKKRLKETSKYHENSHVLSWLTSSQADNLPFQVDFIFTVPEDFAAYSNFIRWGDASMIFGRIARIFDLKYGVTGLERIVRDPQTNHEISLISVSKDPRQIFYFLGYSYGQWEKGFSSERELAEFCFSSSFVTQDFLEAYEKNAKHKTRDKKREQYKRFYSHFLQIRHRFKPSVKFSEEEVLQRIDLYFPEIQIRRKIKEIREDIEKKRLVREKFSGSHMSEILREKNPDILGKEIGAKISGFKSLFKDFEESCLITPKEELELKFKEFIK